MKRVAASADLPSSIGSHHTGCNANLASDTTAGQESLVGEEGGVDDSDVPQLADLPWVVDTSIGEFKYFLPGLQRNGSTPADFERDAQNFENNWARDVRLLLHHCHNHECSSTCGKNQKNKSKEQQARQLKSHRAPPCRFDFFHNSSDCRKY